MPSRWQTEYTCSRCAGDLSGADQGRVVSWSHLTRGQVTLFRLCSRCLDALRAWLYSATFDELWSVQAKP